jgi:hypothetical protein
MFKRIRMLLLSLAALGALAFGGATLANAGSGSNETPGQESTAPENSSSDPDNVQYTPPGERNAETKSATASKKAHRSHARKHSRKHVRHAQASQAPAETPGTEAAPGSETAGETGSETAGNDGPGGHADEPGNPNADHQFQGQE